MTEITLPTLPQADMFADDIYGNPTEWYSRESVMRLLIQNDHEAYVRGVKEMGAGLADGTDKPLLAVEQIREERDTYWKERIGELHKKWDGQADSQLLMELDNLK